MRTISVGLLCGYNLTNRATKGFKNRFLIVLDLSGYPSKTYKGNIIVILGV
jgi:hypothetical protein